MIMSSQVENLFRYVRIPNEDIVVRTGTQNEVVIRIPVEVENALHMTFQGRFRLHIVHPPQANLAVEAGRREQMQLGDRE